MQQPHRFEVTPLVDGPILSARTPGLGSQTHVNINGPSLVRMPSWASAALGRYHLYFADHKGDAIKLAHADSLAGPWRVHEPGALRLDQTPFLQEPPDVPKGIDVARLERPRAPDVPSPLDIPFSLNATNKIGVGGLLTAGRFGNVRISLETAPWTIGAGTAINQTQEGAFQFVTVTGFAHNPASGDSASAVNSGMLQLISPMQITTIGAGANNELQSLFGFVTLHFVPEPGFLLLLAAGVSGLAILGRNRIHK
jgi:hypothetical protein